MKKLAPWIAGAFAVFFIATRPDAAADLVDGAITLITDVADGTGDFLTKVFS